MSIFLAFYCSSRNQTNIIFPAHPCIKIDEFSEKFQGGGGGFSIIKFILILDLQTGFFEHNFLKKFAISFFENEGRGFKSSSVLVLSSVPKSKTRFGTPILLYIVC